MQIPFKKLNLMIIGGGTFMVLLGYILMATENFIDATEFSLSLHVSPVLIILGHVVVVAGILYRPKSDGSEGTEISAETTQKVES